MKNALSWFEIPVNDFARAKKFYETILKAEMQEMEMNGTIAAFFPADLENGIGGSIVKEDGLEPSDKGTTVYLNGGDDLAIQLARVENAGGKVVLPKTAIGENGFMAFFIDTEGNRVGLHSDK